MDANTGEVLASQDFPFSLLNYSVKNFVFTVSSNKKYIAYPIFTDDHLFKICIWNHFENSIMTFSTSLPKRAFIECLFCNQDQTLIAACFDSKLYKCNIESPNREAEAFYTYKGKGKVHFIVE